jgi:acyl dehydratase
MPVLDVERLRAYNVQDCRETYDARDTILYALGIGAGLSDTVDEIDFVFERRLKALPTLALVLGTPGFWAMDPRAGLDWVQILHGEQSLKLYRPLDPQGELVGRTFIGEIADKGPGKPVMLKSGRTLSTPSGQIVAEMEEVWVLRGVGGFGGERDLPHDPLPPMPEGAPEGSIDLPTGRNQAMIYRLSGDRNPLHVEPETAKLGGFDGPILHGLATMGVIGRALVHLCCDGDPSRLSAIRLRFTAPVVPGDVIRTDIWQDGSEIRFRASVPARAIVVADGGLASIGSFAVEEAAERVSA